MHTKLENVAGAVAVVALAAAALIGCRKDGPGDDGKPEKSSGGKGSAESTKAASSPADSASASARASSDDDPASGGGAPVDCDLRWGFHGKVGTAEAFMRLRRDGDRVVGRYFYAKVGVDLPLEGTISKGGEIELDEGPKSARTGHFKGRCDGTTHALAGQWSGGGKEEAFGLEPVATREKPLVATKKRSARGTLKVKGRGEGHMKGCHYAQSTAEIFGAGSPEAEAKLNRQDATTLLPLLIDKELHDEATKCEDAMEAELGTGVSATFSGFITLTTSGYANVEGAAHPANAIDYSSITYSLATGEPMSGKAVVAKLPEALLAKCVKEWSKANELEDGMISIDGSHYVLTADGIEFYGVDYPHVVAALTGSGPIVRWSALLREHALDERSPAKKLWAGVKPGTDPKGDCEVRKEF
jgi:hypothetical protein